MKYLRVDNIRNGETGMFDYGRLDIDRFVPMSQLYPFDIEKDNFFYVITTDDNVISDDRVSVVTFDEYNAYKAELEKTTPPILVTPQEEIADLKKQLADLWSVVLGVDA